VTYGQETNFDLQN